MAGLPPKVRKVLRVGGPALAALYLLLLIPGSAPEPLSPAPKSPFAWNQDRRWKDLESRFVAARGRSPQELREAACPLFESVRGLLARGEAERVGPEAEWLSELEERTFELGILAAAAPELLPEFAALAGSLRDAVKRWSESWDLGSEAARIRLYRLLYGARAALEEAMLQAPSGGAPALTPGRDEPSQTPSALVQGVRVHSGDIFLSRGGAPTSALIARGNDFPGNFSHVALVHVDVASRQVSLIEAHIERGVAVSSVEQYLADRKLRLLLLRLRSDLPALVRNPQLPHEAAGRSLELVRRGHIPYDFAMDFRDHSRLFCSEVASAAYEPSGVTLWMGLSTLSSPALCSWLSQFGVRHSLTQEPSDLEYDPQLRVVAEWRDPEALFQDRLDNAVTDVRLEGAERGDALDYSLPKLPLARTAKAWSWMLNLAGGVGPVPEGMSATAALKMDRFISVHAALRARLRVRAEDFQARKGYRPPYWELLRLAREEKR